MNVFEGSRRIAFLVGAGWLILCIAGAWQGPSTAILAYKQEWPSSELQPRPDTDYCLYPDAEGRVDMMDRGELIARMSICFKAHPSSDGQSLVPYAKSSRPGYFLMLPASSPEVKRYAESTTADAVRSTLFNSKAYEARRAKRLQYWWDAIQFAGGGLIALWLATAAIGWIVRGFAGIPRGHDNKPPPP